MMADVALSVSFSLERPGRKEVMVVPPIPVIFVGGVTGEWRIERIAPVRGESLPSAARLARIEGTSPPPSGTWTLRGTTSNERYVTRAEQEALRAVQPVLWRSESTRAALIRSASQRRGGTWLRTSGARSSRSAPGTFPSACATSPRSRGGSTIAATWASRSTS